MANKYVGAAKFGYQKVVKPAVTAIKKAFSKKSPTITKTEPKVGSLTKRRKDQDDVIKGADKAIKKHKLTSEQKIEVKKTIAPGMKKISKTQDEIDKLQKLRQKKMGGGMMGRRFGYKGGKLVGKQSIIAKQAGDPKKIESVDFKVLQAKRKNKKKVV
tara:strand:+ start:41 stop:514 length:474 start_codon:yes stop_codon:yes gene_type:complete